MTSCSVKCLRAAVWAAFILVFGAFGYAQAPAKSAKVTQIDDAAFKKVSTPAGRPMLVNFWATWCDPCREEFPELVQIDKEYKGKIDFITISLDDPADILTTVPKFLTSMKAEMPAYLLKSADESALIASISKSWGGGMPFTALYNPKGELAYFREGKVVMATLREELNKLLAQAEPAAAPLRR